MSRVRPVFAAACIAALLLAALPAPGAAQRDALQGAAIADGQTIGDSLVGSFLSWGRSAFAWLQAIIAAEHGTIVYAPVAPPTPAPTPTPTP